VNRCATPRARSSAAAGALWVLLSAGVVQAQEATSPAPAVATTPGAEAPAPVPEELRAKLAEIETQIAASAARAAEWSVRSAEYEEARTSAPARLQAIEQEIASLAAQPEVEIAEKATQAELAAQLLSAEQDLALARKEASEFDAETARRAERRKRIPELLASAKERLRELSAAPPAAAQPAALSDAQGRLAAARRTAIEREIEAYERELASYDARGQLPIKRLDRAMLRASFNEALVDRLRDALVTRNQVESEKDAKRARELLEEAAALPPAVQSVVREFAEQNATLAEQRTGSEGLVEKIDEVSRKLARAEGSVASVEADLARLVAKVEAAGLTGSVGLLLRRQRSDAPDVGKYRRFVRMRQDQISAVQLQQIELREQRKGLADIDRIVENAMATLDPALAEEERAQIEVLLHDLLSTKRKYLDELIADYETYFQKLVDFDAKQLELIEKTEELLGYIDARVLWIPSGEAVRPGLVGDGIAALDWLLAPRFWGQFLRAFLDAARAAPLLNAAVVLLLLLGLPLARRLRPRIRALGEEAQAPSCTRYAATWEALLLSLLLVPWLPMLFGYAGWRIGLSPDATQFARCIANGMVAASVFWISIEVFRQLLRPHGIAEAHLGWPSEAVRTLRRAIGSLATLAVPGVFLIFVFELRGEDAWRESVARLTFLILMAGAAAFTYLVMRDPAGAFRRIVHSSRTLRARPWLWRLAHSVALAVPLFLAAASARGFFWTAFQLSMRYHFTLVLLFGLIVVLALGVRWTRLARVRVAMELARERERVREEQAGPLPGEGVSAPAEPQLDLAAADRQTSQLLTSTALFVMVLALWLIWADVLPAAGILREVELWETARTVNVEFTDAAGELRVTSEERLVPVTLADLGLALLIAILTLVLVRNLPGLFEIALPLSVGVGAGERYAFAMIAKYGLTLVGLTLAFRSLGVGWSNIQWLIAAVGLGLGFGLQEIFANFISGLIILFERPIRVGDTVTVGDISGTVMKIRIRATWITGFDRKELVIPNKEFVTGRLINWSLSDAILRVEIPVGIAYGSDTERAIAVLRRVAAENDHVLREPEPQVLFLGFGDSSLSFELRVFSPDVAHLLLIRHEMHMAIDRAFREEGIEIAFPQRDLHLRSVPDSR
jgi:potassium efflux system protein